MTENKFYDNIQSLRANPETCNAWKKWEAHEDELLLTLMKENKKHDDIALELKRTIGSIRAKIIDKLILPEYNSENVVELAKKYKFENSDLLHRLLQSRIQKQENSRMSMKILDTVPKEEYEQKKLDKKIEMKKIKTAGGEKYFEVLQNIVERLERIEKKIDGYDFKVDE
jgi:Mor family transcriptional regulator